MSKLGITPWDIVRVPPFDEGGLVDASTAINSDSTIENFVDEAGAFLTARLMKNTEGQKAFIQEYLPSLYTGGMRKLMQVSHLRGAAGMSSAKHDLFLPDWADTYGVWTSSPIDGFCNRYIIRICSSGVYRYPITFSQPLPENWQALEAAAASISAEAAAQTLGRMWSAGNFDPTQGVKIADTPLMYTNLEGLYYTTCGWAFNARGTSAVNTGVRIDPDDSMGVRKRSSLYRVDITESGGMPVAATCTLVESGELVNQFDDTADNTGTAIIQVPNPDAQERGNCHTLSCYPGTIGPRIFSTNTPVFAFFDPSDALHVVRFTPQWSTASTSSSTSMETARGSIQSFADTTDGDLSSTIALFGPIPASGYPASVLGATFGSDNRVTGRTMRFSSPLITPVPQTYFTNRVDSTFQTYGGTYQATGGAFGLVFMAIEWSVQSINLTNGSSTTFKDFRQPASDSGAQSRVNLEGIVTRSRSYAQDKRYHQVLIMHGYDRTSYAVYNRVATFETGITISYGATNMAVPDPSTLQYNGAWSTGAWFDHKIPSYHSDLTSGNTRNIRTCVGVSKLPSGMLVYRPGGDSAVTPPAGGSEPNIATIDYSGKVVVNGAVHDVPFDGPAVEFPHITFNFFYKAGGSLRIDRGFYQNKENLSPANVFGVGSYAATTGNVTAFVGWF